MNARRWRILEDALTAARARGWHRRAGVVGLGIGQRHTRGSWVARTACVVVRVAWKRALDELSPRARFERWIEVRVDGARHRVRVDLQETRGELVGQCQGLVGGAVSHGGILRGAISAVVTTPGGERAVLIAGHAAPGRGAVIDLAGIVATTRAPVMTSRLDHCLVDPRAPLPPDAGRLPGGRRIAGIAPVHSLAFDQVLYLHHVCSAARVPVRLRAAETSAPFRYATGTRRLSGLLATDGVTVRGDSGTLLYDAAFHAVGTLVGAFGGASYFIPCERAAAMLAIELA